ncbi:MAG: NTP/NDP exchange transporter [Nitrospiraceae bacterium]
MPTLTTLITRLVKAERDEVAPLIWSCIYFFCLLCGYYILRPVRDEMAIQGGVHNLPWMMTATFVVLLAATPLFGFLSSRLPRYRLLLTIYLFFAGNLLIFFGLMVTRTHPEWTARVFFVWLSVFNLFVVSVFWSFMADLFSSEQGARLFGAIAAGGSGGALAGPFLTAGMTYVVPISMLMLISALFLIGCMVCIHQLDHRATERTFSRYAGRDQALKGSIWAGIRLAVSSPYLGGICVYLLLLTTTATFLYLEQMRVIGQEMTSPAERTRLFAGIDLMVNGLSLVVQMFVTNRLIARWGLGSALLFLPAASTLGFVMIGVTQTLAAFILFTVVRRVGEYAVSKPAREVLFTVVSREEKYKAKNFIDTAVSRGGDASTGWTVSGVKALGATTSQIAGLLIPLALLWAWLSWWLAREQGRLSDKLQAD